MENDDLSAYLCARRQPSDARFCRRSGASSRPRAVRILQDHSSLLAPAGSGYLAGHCVRPQSGGRGEGNLGSVRASVLSQSPSGKGWACCDARLCGVALMWAQSERASDVAVIDDRRVLALQGHLTCRQAADMVMANRPAVVAIGSPRSCEPEGQSARDGELRLAKSICGICWTPGAGRVRAGRVLRVDSRGTYSARCAGCPRRRGHPDCIMDSLAWQARPADPRGLDTAGTGSPRSGVPARTHEPIPARRSRRCDDGLSAQSGRTETTGDILVPAGRW
jgi:hypothetical protein